MDILFVITCVLLCVSVIGFAMECLCSDEEFQIMGQSIMYLSLFVLMIIVFLFLSTLY